MIAPDVGGGFGSKLQIYAEETLVCCVRAQARPAGEVDGHALGATWPRTHHGRDQIDYVRLGDQARRHDHRHPRPDPGRHGRATTRCSRRSSPRSAPFVMSGCYKIPAVQTDIIGVFTNKIAHRRDPRRRAARGDPPDRDDDGPGGRRARDGPARAPAEELHPQGGLPGRGRGRRRSTTPATTTGALDKLLANLDLDALPARAGGAARAGQLPRRRVLDLHGDLRPRAVARGRARAASASRPASGSPRSCACTRPASATVFTGASPHGQGHETGFAQIVADRIGIAARAGRDRPRRHRARARTAWAPTARARWRWAASRRPARRTRWPTRPRRSSPTCSRPRPRTSSCADGKYQVRGSPDKAHDASAEVAGAAYIPEDLPEGMEPGLEETTFYDPENFVLPFGAHACVVDVDVETGKVEVVRYVCVDDCGPGDQPDADRRPGPRRRHPRHRAGALRAGRLRRERASSLTGTFVGLRAATAAEVPSLRDRPHGDAVAGQLARGQGRRRGGHDRRSAGGHQRGHRRARAAGRAPTSTCR